MRLHTLVRTAALAAAAASLAGSTAAAAYARDNGHHPASHAWPQRLIDRSPDLVQPQAITVDRSIDGLRDEYVP